MEKYSLIFDKIEEKFNVSQDDLMKIAASMNIGDFQDDQTVRQLIQSICELTQVSISNEKEEELVQAIISQDYL